MQKKKLATIYPEVQIIHLLQINSLCMSLLQIQTHKTCACISCLTYMKTIIKEMFKREKKKKRKHQKIKLQTTHWSIYKSHWYAARNNRGNIKNMRFQFKFLKLETLQTVPKHHGLKQQQKSLRCTAQYKS